ncbi:hypothetical protein IMSHALPRED_010935 [Imshaugia aleurites]|uniref:DUF7907 domain-containing protein n=1 Tax=Imshaugia aleurites TaxID=172621 RepID=A0A8H3IQR4_9LECA|nr:hypothetical protein IMSHALPRED_010935 [Imshaugia aleurites]
MLSTLLSLSALLVSTSLAQYPPAYLTASDVFGTTCTTCGMIGAFPTGPKTNVAILTNDTSKALTGQFDDSYWTFNGFNATHSLHMSPTADNPAFPHYGSVGINPGFDTDGFSEGDEDGLLVWNNTDMANEGSFFAVCPTVIPGYEAAGVQDRVFWQSNEAPAEGTVNCTTIVLHGAFEGAQEE